MAFKPTMSEMVEEAQKLPGFPSFAEFCKNRSRYAGGADDLFECADAGSKTIKHLIEKHKYSFEQYEVDTLEKAERIIKEEGLDPQHDVEMLVQLEQGSMRDKYICHVKFTRKTKIPIFKDLKGFFGG